MSAVIYFIAIVDGTSGEILRIEMAPPYPPPAGLYDEFENTHLVYIYEDLMAGPMTPLEFKQQRFWDFGSDDWASREPPPNNFAIWMGTEWDPRHDRLLNSAREERNEKLRRSDWTQLPDSGKTGQTLTDWRTYRQQLRDFPATVDMTGVKDLNDLVWPTPPE